MSRKQLRSLERFLLAVIAVAAFGLAGTGWATPPNVVVIYDDIDDTLLEVPIPMVVPADDLAPIPDAEGDAAESAEGESRSPGDRSATA